MTVHLWPHTVLKPLAIRPNPVAFTRGGGRTLDGNENVTRTDRGWWEIAYQGVPLASPEERKAWHATRVAANGRSGLLAVPVWSDDAAPWPAGAVGGELLTPHSDDTPHDDGTEYSQPAIVVENVALAILSATSITLRAVFNITDLSGIRFSYQHALYETGRPSAISGSDWTLPIFPAIRAPIPAGAALEVSLPTCLVHLADDRAMDVLRSRGKVDRVDVAFVEATDYWNELALS